MDKRNMTQEQPKILNWESFKNFFHESWHLDMKKFIESEECFKIYQKLRSEPKGSVIPKSDKLWNAFQYDRNNLKVVFMGMCPYHTRDGREDFADGLCFSTKLKKTPPSLKLIYDGLRENYPDGSMERFNDLHFWGLEGVLLLNAGLTTSYLKAGNHIELWKPLHEFLYREVFSKINGLIFLYFGKEAAKYQKLETPFIHYSKVVEHPAFAARQNREWEHDNCFLWVNNILKQNNGFTINFNNEIPF